MRADHPKHTSTGTRYHCADGENPFNLPPRPSDTTDLARTIGELLSRGTGSRDITLARDLAEGLARIYTGIVGPAYRPLTYEQLALKVTRGEIPTAIVSGNA